MLTLLLYVLLATSFLTILLVWMIKKYYWGPDGCPPQYRHPGDEPNKVDNTRQPEQSGDERQGNP